MVLEQQPFDAQGLLPKSHCPSQVGESDRIRPIADEDLDHAIDEVRLHQGRKLNEIVGRPLMEHQRLVLQDWEAHAAWVEAGALVFECGSPRACVGSCSWR